MHEGLSSSRPSSHALPEDMATCSDGSSSLGAAAGNGEEETYGAEHVGDFSADAEGYADDDELAEGGGEEGGGGHERPARELHPDDVAGGMGTQVLYQCERVAVWPSVSACIPGERVRECVCIGHQTYWAARSIRAHPAPLSSMHPLPS
jgi:hypothetical protein